MADFKPDEIVRITIDPARVVQHDGEDLTVRYHGTEQRIPLAPPNPATSGAVTVERVAPAEWPPTSGDLWRDRNDATWFAVDVHDIEVTDKPEIVLVSEDNYRLPPDEANQEYGPLTLEHRKGEMAATDA